jgi:polyisoprenyl-teichoic acid--peptidoglycan teichoic acid transferase
MEENNSVENRRPIRGKKRLRKGRVFLLVILLLIIGTVIYTVVQFRAGLKLAGDNKIEVEQFEPDEKTGAIENYLILGIDSRGEEQSRTDTMMILSWNRDTNDMKLVSLMRDIYADIPNYQSYKLNTAYYLGGVQLLKDTITNMFDIPIHHYALIDFKNFESLIDIVAPNGVKMEVEKDMSENIDVQLTKGTHNLNGKELLGYARFRMDAEGDFGRVERQQKVIEALKDEVISLSSIKNIPKLIGAAQGYITTDVKNSEQLSTVLKVVAGGGVSIEKLTIPQKGAFQYKSYRHAGSVIELDLDKNKQILHDFLNIQ